MPTLLLIDLQPTYLRGENERVIKPVLKLIDKIRNRGWGIVVLEYGYRNCYGQPSPVLHQPTDEGIRSSLSDCNPHYVVKYSNCGSNEFLSTARKHNLPLDKIYVAGVNRGACVYETIMPLKDYQVRIVRAATWDKYGCPNRSLERLRRLKNVKLARIG